MFDRSRRGTGAHGGFDSPWWDVSLFSTVWMVERKQILLADWLVS